MRQSRVRRVLKAVSHYLPDLLLHQIINKKTFDPSKIISLSGGMLQADASGFTKMSEVLSKSGKEGAEELTHIFNRFFSSMLKIVFAHGGDVLKFGGDSLLVFFKGNQGAFLALAAALEIERKMKNFQSISVLGQTFSLALHVGVNAGEFFAISLGEPGEKLELAIVGEDVNLTIRCNETAGPGEILLTQNCYREVQSQVQILEKREEFFKIHDLRKKRKSYAKPVPVELERGNPERLLRSLIPYLPKGVYKKIESDPFRSLVESEHRKVTVIFLNLIYSDKLLEEISAKKKEAYRILNDYFKTVQEVVRDYGGVITRIDPYSTGDKVLILFGAPVAQEDDEERAILCALKIKERFGALYPHHHQPVQQRIGVNTGGAFCGEVGSSTRREYTVMGRGVNLAARLMSKAGWGQILAGEETFGAVVPKFKASKTKIEAKGINQLVVAFQIMETIKPIKSNRVFEKRAGGERKTPLVGREEEVALIERIIAKVMNQKGQILSIVGEPGIGKSRLTERLLELCLEKKMRGLLVNCQFYGSNTALLPWTEILRNHCGMEKIDDQSIKVKKLNRALKKIDADRWAPLFSNILGLSLPENEWTKSLEGETRRRILFDTIIDLILDRTKDDIIYLILEDIHWIDQASLELLLNFSQRISAYPVFLVLVHRPELKVKELERMENHQKIQLDELKRDDAFHLASAHLHIAQLPDQIERLVWEKSRGNPLYLQELIHSLRESDYLVWNKEEESYTLSCHPNQIQIPHTIRDVIMTRIDKLDEMARKVIKTASVIGRTFSFDTLASILPYHVTDKELKSWLDYLDKLDLVPLKGTQPDLRYTFKHALTQEVAYNLLPFTQRRNLHGKIGQYYERKFRHSLEERCELLAHHYDNSSDLNKAFIYLIRSGEKSKHSYSNQEAIGFYDRAERIYQKDLMAKKQKRRIRRAFVLMSELLEHRGEVYKLTGDYCQAERDFLTMLDLSKSAKNKAKQIKSLNCLGELFWLRGDYDTSQSYVEKAHRISRTRKDEVGLAMSFNNFGDIYRRQGSFEKALESYRASLKHYKRVKDSEGIARSHNNIGISLWSLGSLSEAAKYFERALEVRRGAGDKVGEAKTSNNLALIYQDRGNLQQSVEMLNNALEIFRRIGDRRNAGYCLGNLGTIYKSQAEFSKALSAFQDSVQIFSEIGDQHALTYSIGNIGDVQLKMGNLDEAKRCYHQTLSAARKLGDEELESETLSRLGVYHLLLEELESSENNFRRALALAEKIKSNEFTMKALAGLTELLLKTEDHSEASKNSKKLLRLAQEENTREYEAKGYLLSGKVKASLSFADKAESDFRKALEISSKMGLKEVSYKAHLELGRLYDDLADIGGRKFTRSADDQFTRAQKILQEIASGIKKPELRKTFLNSHLNRVSRFKKKLLVMRS